MKLWLIRHAKSSWTQAGLTDFERPLNGRGERDGPKVAAWLATLDHPATWIWTSPAVRALATTNFVQQGFGLDSTSTVPLGELYHASPEDILDVIRQTPSDTNSVAVVAHNPGLTYLANALGTSPATDNLPTFGIARFECPTPWRSLQSGGATLDFLQGPKGLAWEGPKRRPERPPERPPETDTA